MKPLLLWWRRTPVGTLGLVQGERMEFRYTAEWLALSASFPVSLSLPLQAGPHGDVAHHFFANLLPEADAADCVSGSRSLPATTSNCCGRLAESARAP